jgi:hypothetical protein
LRADHAAAHLAPVSASPVVIATYANEFEALVAQAVLDAHEIPSMLLRDDAGGMQVALSDLHGIRLAVRHADAVRALYLLDTEIEDPEERRDAS